MHKAEFGYDNDFLLVILSSGELFSQEFLVKAKKFEDSLVRTRYITRVTSPLSQKHLVNGPTGLLVFPLIHIDHPTILKKDSIRIFSNPFYTFVQWQPLATGRSV